MATLTTVVSEVPSSLSQVQATLGIVPSSAITSMTLTLDDKAEPVQKARIRATLAVTALTAAVALLLIGLVDGLLLRHGSNKRRRLDAASAATDVPTPRSETHPAPTGRGGAAPAAVAVVEHARDLDGTERGRGPTANRRSRARTPLTPRPSAERALDALLASRPQTRHTDQPRRGVTDYVDATTALTCYLVLLLLIPSRLVVGPLGAAGGLAALFSITLSLWWGWFHLQRGPSDYQGKRPVRAAALVLLACVMVSYVAADIRPMPPVEANGADTGVLRALGWIAVVVVANDGITNRLRFDTLIRRFVLAGALMATLGLVQTFTGTTVVDQIAIPGLTSNVDSSGVVSRNGFTRSTATAIHPLEYAVVLTAALPLAITRGLTSIHRGALRRWLPAGLIVAATVMSVSRTAIIGVVVAIAVLAPAWTRPVRRSAILVGGLVLGSAYVLVPGLLGAITSLLSGIQGGDDSARSRTDSYDTAFGFVARSPFVGRRSARSYRTTGSSTTSCS